MKNETCDTCGRETYINCKCCGECAKEYNQPRGKRFSLAKWYLGTMDFKKSFVKTGEFRSVNKGEYFLSRAIPEVYIAVGNSKIKYHIMRKLRGEK